MPVFHYEQIYSRDAKRIKVLHQLLSGKRGSFSLAGVLKCDFCACRIKRGHSESHSSSSVHTEKENIPNHLNLVGEKSFEFGKINICNSYNQQVLAFTSNFQIEPPRF